MPNHAIVSSGLSTAVSALVLEVAETVEATLLAEEAPLVLVLDGAAAATAAAAAAEFNDQCVKSAAATPASAEVRTSPSTCRTASNTRPA